MITEQKTVTDHPVHEYITARWSPNDFEDRSVPRSELASLFEAARWAASSYNEQPWSFLVSTKENPEDFQKILSCLTEGNQAWAKSAPVLALAVVNRKLARNGMENRSAVHDLGLASANLTFEATSRGLVVHQMAGIHPEKARNLYGIPDDCEVWTALAIGYLKNGVMKDAAGARRRKQLREFVFTGKWGTPFLFES